MPLSAWLCNLCSGSPPQVRCEQHAILPSLPGPAILEVAPALKVSSQAANADERTLPAGQQATGAIGVLPTQQRAASSLVMPHSQLPSRLGMSPRSSGEEQQLEKRTLPVVIVALVPLVPLDDHPENSQASDMNLLLSRLEVNDDIRGHTVASSEDTQGESSRRRDRVGCTWRLRPQYCNTAARKFFGIQSAHEYSTILQAHARSDPLFLSLLHDILKLSTSGSRAARLATHIAINPVTKSLYGIRLEPCFWKGADSQLRQAVLIEHDVPLQPQHTMSRVVRDYAILSQVDAIITVLDHEGQVLFQNAQSVRYMGNLQGLDLQHLPAPALPPSSRTLSAPSHTSLSDLDLLTDRQPGEPGPASYTAGLPSWCSLLALVLQGDCGKLQALCMAVAEDKPWSGMAKVPRSLKKLLASHLEKPVDPQPLPQPQPLPVYQDPSQPRTPRHRESTSSPGVLGSRLRWPGQSRLDKATSSLVMASAPLHAPVVPQGPPDLPGDMRQLLGEDEAGVARSALSLSARARVRRSSTTTGSTTAAHQGQQQVGGFGCPPRRSSLTVAGHMHSRRNLESMVMSMVADVELPSGHPGRPATVSNSGIPSSAHLNSSSQHDRPASRCHNPLLTSIPQLLEALRQSSTASAGEVVLGSVDSAGRSSSASTDCLDLHLAGAGALEPGPGPGPGPGPRLQQAGAAPGAAASGCGLQLAHHRAGFAVSASASPSPSSRLGREGASTRPTLHTRSTTRSTGSFQCHMPAGGEEGHPVTPVIQQQQQLGAEGADGGGGEGAEPGKEREGAGEAEEPGCWHELQVRSIVDPVTHQQVLLVMQRDMSERVELEQRLASLITAQMDMLSEMFPRHVLQLLARHGKLQDIHSCLDRDAGSSERGEAQRHVRALARQHRHVTILFTDIVGFTTMSKEVDASEVMLFLSQLFSMMDDLVDKHGIYKVETAGDCYIAAGGLVRRDDDGFNRLAGGSTRCSLDEREQQRQDALAVFRFAQDIQVQARAITMPHNGQPVRLRVGLHSGPLVSGVIGTKMPKFALFGDTMNTASRMESTCPEGCIQVSEPTYKLLPPECGLEYTGGVDIKGKGRMDTYVHYPPGAKAAVAPAAQRQGPGKAHIRTQPSPQESATAAAAVFLDSHGSDYMYQTLGRQATGSWLTNAYNLSEASGTSLQSCLEPAPSTMLSGDVGTSGHPRAQSEAQSGASTPCANSTQVSEAVYPMRGASVSHNRGGSPTSAVESGPQAATDATADAEARGPSFVAGRGAASKGARLASSGLRVATAAAVGTDGCSASSSAAGAASGGGLSSHRPPTTSAVPGSAVGTMGEGPASLAVWDGSRGGQEQLSASGDELTLTLMTGALARGGTPPGSRDVSARGQGLPLAGRQQWPQHQLGQQPSVQLEGLMELGGSTRGSSQGRGSTAALLNEAGRHGPSSMVKGQQQLEQSLLSEEGSDSTSLEAPGESETAAAQAQAHTAPSKVGALASSGRAGLQKLARSISGFGSVSSVGRAGQASGNEAGSLGACRASGAADASYPCTGEVQQQLRPGCSMAGTGGNAAGQATDMECLGTKQFSGSGGIRVAAGSTQLHSPSEARGSPAAAVPGGPAAQHRRGPPRKQASFALVCNVLGAGGDQRCSDRSMSATALAIAHQPGSPAAASTSTQLASRIQEGLGRQAGGDGGSRQSSGAISTSSGPGFQGSRNAGTGSVGSKRRPPRKQSSLAMLAGMVHACGDDRLAGAQVWREEEDADLLAD